MAPGPALEPAQGAVRVLGAGPALEPAPGPALEPALEPALGPALGPALAPALGPAHGGSRACRASSPAIRARASRTVRLHSGALHR